VAFITVYIEATICPFSEENCFTLILILIIRLFYFHISICMLVSHIVTFRQVLGKKNWELFPSFFFQSTFVHSHTIILFILDK